MSKKLIFLNGSPRADSRSNSKKMIHYLTRVLKDQFDAISELNALKLYRKKEFDASFPDILESDTLVIVSPLYVDSVPSGLLDFLYEFECFTKKHPEMVTHPLKVYAYINCGFLGGHQNHIALEIMENFSNRMHFNWCGGLGVGSGEMLASTFGKIPRESQIQHAIYEGLDTLTDAIKNGTTINTQHHQLLVTQKFSFSLFCFMLNMNWIALSHWKFISIYNKPYLH